MLKNFVLETANAPGTSTTFNLGGAASGRLSFSGAGFTNGQLVFYVMDDGTQKEWGIATFNTGSPNTLSRTTVINNSVGTTARLNFTGTTNVYNGLPAEYTIYKDSAGKAAIPATSTNDNAAAGFVGEFMESQGGNNPATATITIATPAVITKTGHTLKGIAPVFFTTTGALPTGLVANTTYWTIPSSLTTNTFQVATSPANAAAGTAVNTSGTQSGTHTCTEQNQLATAVNTVCAINLTAGDWDVSGNVVCNPAGSTVTNQINVAINTVANTLPAGAGNGSESTISPTSSAGAANTLIAGVTRISLSVTTLVYLLVQPSFSVSTMNGYGYLRARRVR